MQYSAIRVKESLEKVLTDTIHEITSSVFKSYRPVLLEILENHPDGISEYDLFQRLAELGRTDFKDALRSGVLELFQSHFLLFHLLYRLRRELLETTDRDLEIGCLSIRLTRRLARTSEDGIVVSDPMERYYLNAENLSKTSREDVEQMLGKFWERYHSRESIHEALQVLGLETGATYSEMKSRYRALAREKHPDAGGSSEGIQELNRAKEVLDRYYGQSGSSV